MKQGKAYIGETGLGISALESISINKRTPVVIKYSFQKRMWTISIGYFRKSDADMVKAAREIVIEMYPELNNQNKQS